MAEKTKKTELTPDQARQERKAAQLFAFNRWRLDWRAANPEATKEDRSAAWKAVRKSEVRKSRKALRAVTKNGFTLESRQA
jgi:hypothetical protein